MSDGNLKLYSASAGSGKTHELTGNYLTLLLGSSAYGSSTFRNILSVTFTNKAAAEMKERILRELHLIAEGGNSKFFSRLIPEDTAKEESDRVKRELQKRSALILKDILQDYSRFSVGTIDSFFQRVLRMFTREVGIYPGYSLELDDKMILQEAVEGTVSSVDDNPDLLRWLSEFAEDLVSQGQNWNLEREINKLARELFNENFKLLGITSDPEYASREKIRVYRNSLVTLLRRTEKELTEAGSRGLALAGQYGISDEMVARKSQGFLGFFRKLADGNFSAPGKHVLNAVEERKIFGKVPGVPKEGSPGFEAVFNLLTETISLCNRSIIVLRSAEAILANMYTLGIMHDLSSKLKEINSEGNTFLLSDTGYLLRRLIGGDQAPFIYEKVGTHYNHILIDEFQDTSIIQYENFRPLMENAMSQGYECMIVGDLKQSIYRWRNSNWKIMAHYVADTIGEDRITRLTLPENHRSFTAIIAFNNTLFTRLPQILDNEFQTDSSNRISFANLYSGAVQTDGRGNSGGYVNFEFFEGKKEEWQGKAMEKLPFVIQDLIKAGYKPSEIGILVRDKAAGELVVRTLIHHRESNRDNKEYIEYSVISDQSLLINQSAAVVFITSVIEWWSYKNDLTMAIMIRNYLIASCGDPDYHGKITRQTLKEVAAKIFPEGYEESLDRAAGKPLYEAVVSVVSFFRLGDVPENIPFINSFLDLVLSFSGKKSSDLSAFLTYWQEVKDKQALSVSGSGTSVRVMTIHKSKGLDFRAVILPSLDWGMDHGSLGPILWTTPEVEPFNMIPVIPVKYNSRLAETIFRNDYLSEKYSSFVDNLNLLYVAMTRAREVLIGFGKAYKKDSLSNISGLMQQALSLNQTENSMSKINLAEWFDNERLKFEYGTLPGPEMSHDKIRVAESPEMSLTDPLSRLKLKYNSEKFLTSGTKREERINYGRIMHILFSRIIKKDDLVPAIEALVESGELPSTSRDEVLKRVRLSFDDDLVSDWFDGSWKVLNEREILHDQGSISIPDRVMVKDGKAVVIDFKFGEEQKKYLSQVERYSNLLREMGFKEVSAFLWYVDLDKITKLN